MLISDKQHQANLQNAQHSTGPKTPEGKQAVRFNALAWSLRAQTVILPNEDPMDYQQLWENWMPNGSPKTPPNGSYSNRWPRPSGFSCAPARTST